MLELFVGQIPEAIYFALFMIFTKRLKEKRVLFTLLMVVEYILLKQFLHYTMWFQVLYTFITFLILKVLYKQQAQITDIFTFMIGSFILILISSVPYAIIYFTIQNFYVYVVISRILLFLFLFLFKNKLPNIQKIYKKLWNRNDSVKKKMKTTTFRCINIILFNLMFYLINLYIVCTLFVGRGV